MTRTNTNEDHFYHRWTQINTDKRQAWPQKGSKGAKTEFLTANYSNYTNEGEDNLTADSADGHGLRGRASRKRHKRHKKQTHLGREKFNKSVKSVVNVFWFICQ
jgi:hypothetical protein